MKRSSFKSLIMRIVLLGFCSAQIQAMRRPSSASSRINDDTEFLNNNSPHSDIAGDAFYTATTLQELIEKRGLEDGTIEYDTPEKAATHYAEINPELKSIISHFQDPEFRTTRAYTHGAILIGPPGVGKTTDGFAIAKHINCKVVKIEAPMLCDIYQNSGSTKLARLYSLLTNYGRPVILIVDELNSLTEQHRVVGEKVNLAMIDALIVWLDKFKKSNVFVIFTSNGIKDYPAKFYSRLGGNIIYYDFPDLNARRRMIESNMAQYCFGDDEAVIGELVEYLALKSSGFSLRDIELMLDFGYRNAQKRTGNYTARVVLTKQDFKGTRKKRLETLHNESFLSRLNTAYKDHSYAYTALAAIAGLALTSYGFKHARYLFDLQNFRSNFIQSRSTTYLNGVPFIGSTIKDKAVAKATHEAELIISSLRGWSFPDVKDEVVKRWWLPIGLAGDEIKFIARKTGSLSGWMWHGVAGLWNRG